MRYGLALLPLLMLGLVSCGSSPRPVWQMEATILESCSCPHFCQCFFDNPPALHDDPDRCYCRFNSAFRVGQGHHGETSLDGALFWVAGDLGSCEGSGPWSWAEVTFDPQVTPAQRDGILRILRKLYVNTWKAFSIREESIHWHLGDGHADAWLGEDASTAAVHLRKSPHYANPGQAGEPTVIRNLRYMRAPENDGFLLMPCTLSAYRNGDLPFEYSGRTGFAVTTRMDALSCP